MGSDVLCLDRLVVGFFADLPRFPRYFGNAWDYWIRLSNEREGVPLKVDFDPMAITDALPHIILTEVIGGPVRDFRFKVYGDSIDSRMRRAYSGKTLSAVHPNKGNSSIWAAYEEAVDAACPVLIGVPYVGAIPGIRYTMELYLPLSSEGVPVSHVAVIVDFDNRQPVAAGKTRWSR